MSNKKTVLDGMTGDGEGSRADVETVVIGKQARSGSFADLSPGSKLQTLESSREWYYLEPLPQGGGFCETHLVEDHGHGKRLLMKALRTEWKEQPAVRSAFREEARALAGFPFHPHLVPVVGFEELQGIPCIFMEYVKGRPLGAYLRSGAASSRIDGMANPPVGEAGRAEGMAALLRETGGRSPHIRHLVTLLAIARGLRAAHETNRTLHLDLSPANILVGDADGCVRVIDFGLPKTLAALGKLDGGRSRSGGTEGYRAPEMAQGFEACDTRSDVYSFGLVALSLWLGRVLAVGEGERWRARHAETGCIPGLPDDQRLILSRCLREDPAGRPSGFAEVEDALCDAYYRLFARMPDDPWAEDGPEALLERAKTLLDLKRPRDGLVLAEKALSLDAGDDTLLTLASALWELGETIAAEAAMGRVSAQGRSDFRYHQLRGWIAFLRGDFQGATDAAREAEAFDPDNQLAMAGVIISLVTQYGLGDRSQGLGKEIVRRYRDYRERFPVDRIGLELGRMISGNVELGIDFEAELEALLPTDWDGRHHSAMAWLLKEGGRIDRAMELLERALRIDPFEASYKVRLAVLRSEKGDRDGARALFEEALAEDPYSFDNYWEVINSAGKRSWDRDYIDKIVARYERSPNFSASNAVSLRVLAWIARKEPAAAEAAAREAAALRLGESGDGGSKLILLLMAAAEMGNHHFGMRLYDLLAGSTPKGLETGQLLLMGTAFREFGIVTVPTEARIVGNMLRVLRVATEDGPFQKAELIFRELASRHPHETTFSAHLMGVLALECRLKDAIALGEGLRADPLAVCTAMFWNQLGICHQDTDEPEAAATCFRNALALAPRDATIITNLIQALRWSEKFKEGIQAAVEWLDKGGKPNWEYWNYRSWLHGCSDDDVGKAECLYHMLELKPEDHTTLFTLYDILAPLGKKEEWVAMAEGCIAAMPPGQEPEASLLDILSQWHGSQGRFDRQEHYARRAVAAQNAYTSYAANLMDCLMKQGKAQETVDAARAWMAARKDGPSALFWNLLGRAFVDLSMLPKASRCFAKALRLDPANANDAHNVVAVLNMRGMLAEAAAAGEKWLASDKGEPTMGFWDQMGLAYLNLPDHEKALVCYWNKSRLNPADPTDAATVLFLLAKLGRQWEAAEEGERWLAEGDKTLSANFWNQLGKACYKLERVARAAECNRKAAELDSSHSTYADNYIALSFSDGDHDRPRRARCLEAIEFAEEWIRSGKPELGATGINALGNCYDFVERPADSTRCYLLSIEKGEDSDDVAGNLIMSLRKEGRAAEAVAFMEKWLSSHKPDTSHFWMASGRTYAAAGKKDKAREAFMRAIDCGANPSETRFEIAKLK